MTSQNAKRSAALDAWVKKQEAKDREQQALAASERSARDAAEAIKTAWRNSPEVQARRAAAERTAAALLAGPHREAAGG
jgi:hypothetical protein